MRFRGATAPFLTIIGFRRHDMIAYIVTTGDYSDYGIESVWKTKKLAQTRLGELGGNGQVEEYVINVSVKKLGSWFVRMRKNGDVVLINSHGVKPKHLIQANMKKVIVREVKDIVMQHPEEEVVMDLICSAKDEKHAVKIANEVRIMKIVLDKWAIDLVAGWTTVDNILELP
jgi:hypothetical protein